jgi:enterochelin esterase family protein
MNNRIIIITIFLYLIVSVHGQTFSDFVVYLNDLPAQDRQAKVDSFINANEHFPLYENDTVCNFIYQGNAQSVSVPGDATGWNPTVYTMSNVDETDLWYFTKYFASDTRLDYKFVLNGSNWILDPKNPLTVMGGFGPNSEMAMPLYVQPPEIQYYPGIPHGTLFDTIFYSEQLGNSRQIKVYLPPYYETSPDKYPVVLFHDGLDYLNLAYAKNVLDYFLSSDCSRPVIAVFVPPVNREPEYAGDQIDEFTAFIIEDIIPWVDDRFRTKAGPGNRLVLGASNGGNISLWIAMKHPEVFGKVAAYSSNIIDEIATTFAEGPFLNLDIYIDIGTYDIDVLIPMIHNFRDILDNRGYPFIFNEWNDGHSWGNWRAHIDNSLNYFFPPACGAGENSSSKPVDLKQNFPNPAGNYTTVSFSAPAGSEAELVLFDIKGKLISVLWKGTIRDGNTKVIINTGKLKKGIYFYKLTVNRQVVLRKMIKN